MALETDCDDQRVIHHNPISPLIILVYCYTFSPPPKFFHSEPTAHSSRGSDSVPASFIIDSALAARGSLPSPFFLTCACTTNERHIHHCPRAFFVSYRRMDSPFDRRDSSASFYFSGGHPSVSRMPPFSVLSVSSMHSRVAVRMGATFSHSESTCQSELARFPSTPISCAWNSPGALKSWPLGPVRQFPRECELGKIWRKRAEKPKFGPRNLELR